jgi:hypothetical protein
MQRARALRVPPDNAPVLHTGLVSDKPGAKTTVGESLTAQDISPAACSPGAVAPCWLALQAARVSRYCRGTVLLPHNGA